MSTPITSLFDVEGKVALVTGGTSGIGKMIARGLVEAGMRVYVSSRKPDACEAVAAELGGDGLCIGVPADISKPADVERLVTALGESESELHLLVNNAGTTWGDPLETYPDAAFAKVLDLNVRAVFRLTVELLPLLAAAGREADPARVVNVSSIEATRVPEWENYAYPASKAAVEMLTRQLARRLAPRHITVNAIAPGPFPSRMISFAQEDPQLWAELLDRIPLGRAGESADAVGAVVFLASRAGAYLTGAVVPLDGGFVSVG
ncbi:MAG TPA: SDR family oxidoreductase [Solirubrobacterales bacterium]|jgi:NAD(P)-dependent dehydrogenase (short-subunit alcohol dehydrogenase family)|nr:SDR family oxidoreductase [Solirubrobacterales bacterium]